MTDDRSFLKVESLALAACTSRFFGAFRDFDPKKKSSSTEIVSPPSVLRPQYLTVGSISQLDLTMNAMTLWLSRLL